MATTEQKLRKAMRGYLEYLGNMPLAERITNAAAFEDVYRFLLDGSGRLELRRADVAAVRVFLWNYQYQRCAMTGKKVALNHTTLDHDHHTGKVRAVIHRAANSAEGGYRTGNMARMPKATADALVRTYRRQYHGLAVLYPS
ncbi:MULTISPECIES: endonuclease domain-containing protein [Enterobacteriaceae]|uniref:Endonuclease domain-containing protein n=1 Tax=Phytobacter ursingii TaxID=1972431 RepID=A0AB35RKC2_9ENTR|nr:MULTISPECIES: endonuclease domain-containing protein [Enterobacteriaceae]MCL7672045.1 endonuclease domain-containing protein [Enterobacter cloacae complex sp. OE43NF]MDP0435210.1 endonuclease domain-containing protein [Enterobacter hormaechei]MDV2862561.1 endonuclease domain-containing protein [Phytobacter ursingii]DAG37623.1 MAG TPA: Recombination endonuclease VII [Bacteriophage sp.]